MDIEELLKSLNVHNVEFVIIGATAFPVHFLKFFRSKCHDFINLFGVEENHGQPIHP